MAFSIQTNVNAIIGQENLRVNGEFQSRTINRLTSGFRINSSGDDAAGLSVANKYRSQVMELQQGVRNANDGISSLQIIDGGLNNISKVLDRLKTLATQSATDTFEGDRSILETEYNTLLSEIDRQAANIGLSTGTVGGRYNRDIKVYIGGGQGILANSQVSVDLAGSSDRVDATSLGIKSTSILGGGGNTVGTVDLRSGSFLLNSTQAITLHFGNNVTVSATLGNNGAAMSGQQIIDQLNSQIAGFGVNASINQTSGYLEFSGSSPYNVLVGAVTGGGSAAATAAAVGTNTSMYRVTGDQNYAAPTTTAQVLDFVVDGTTTSVTLALTTTIDQAINQINAAMNSQGVYALKNAAGTRIEFQSGSAFTLAASGADTATGVFNTDGAQTITTPTASATSTGNALLALSAIGTAVTRLGNVQGKVGTGQNKLQYALQLAQSQISNFSAAESRIRDADVAAEAANLTKAQVLQQASLAAMAQANSAPQAVLGLLRG